jgi:hypothetical protein
LLGLGSYLSGEAGYFSVPHSFLSNATIHPVPHNPTFMPLFPVSYYMICALDTMSLNL